jgi:hypothetical protein
MTSEIITFGCSHTFGEGLPDALVDLTAPENRIPIPSKYAWPAVLGELSNRPVINLGQCGESNKFICNKILNSYFNKNEHTVIVMWTYFTRSCVYVNEQKTLRLIPYNTQNFAGVPREKIKFNREYYKRFFFYRNAFFESYQNINHAKLYLDKLGVKNYHFCLEDNPYYDEDHQEFLQTPIWNQVDLKYIKFIEDYAADRDHYSIASHKDMAEKIYNVIKE